MYNFQTTSRPFYFSRNNDFIYNLQHEFILKIKPLLEKDLNKNIVSSFVLSRKVGNAVERNKMKRRLRVIFHNLSTNILHRNFAYILIVKKGFSDLSFSELENKIIVSLNEMFSHRKFVSYVKKSCTVN